MSDEKATTGVRRERSARGVPSWRPRRTLTVAASITLGEPATLDIWRSRRAPASAVAGWAVISTMPGMSLCDDGVRGRNA